VLASEGFCGFQGFGGFGYKFFFGAGAFSFATDSTCITHGQRSYQTPPAARAKRSEPVKSIDCSYRNRLITNKQSELTLQ
jgi:hypothetical protein